MRFPSFHSYAEAVAYFEETGKLVYFGRADNPEYGIFNYTYNFKVHHLKIHLVTGEIVRL